MFQVTDQISLSKDCLGEICPSDLLRIALLKVDSLNQRSEFESKPGYFLILMKQLQLE